MASDHRIDRAERTIRASPDDVWRELSDAERLARWLPPKGARGEVHAFDLWPGGEFRLTLHFPPGVAGKAGPSRDEIKGRIVTVEPPRLLAWEVEFPSDDPAYAGTMAMRWTITASSSGSLVAVAAIDPPAGIDSEVHRQALAESLANLATAAEPAV